MLPLLGGNKVYANTGSPYAFLAIRNIDEEKGENYHLPYIYTDECADNKGTNSQKLFDLINQARATYQKGDIIACHCSVGVGRTGTFIEGFVMLEELDRQIASGKLAIDISPQELFYKLALQRAYSVSKAKQYLLLHQLVSTYMAKR